MVTTAPSDGAAQATWDAMHRFSNDSNAAAAADAAAAAAVSSGDATTSPDAPATPDATAGSPAADPSSSATGNNSTPTAAAHPAPTVATNPAPGPASIRQSSTTTVATAAASATESASPVHPASSAPRDPSASVPIVPSNSAAASAAPGSQTQEPCSAADHPPSPLTGDPAADPDYARDLIRLLENTGGRERWIKAMPKSIVVKIWPRINPASDPAAYHYSLLLLHVPWRHEDELMGGHADHTAAFLAQRSRITAATANDIMGQAVEAECRRLHAAGMCTLADMDDPQHGLCNERLATQCAAYDPSTFVTTQARGSSSDIAAAMVVQGDTGGVAAGQVGPRMTDHEYALRLASMSAAQRLVHSRVRDHVLRSQGSPGAAAAPTATVIPHAAAAPAASMPAATAAQGAVAFPGPLAPVGNDTAAAAPFAAAATAANGHRGNTQSDTAAPPAAAVAPLGIAQETEDSGTPSVPPLHLFVTGGAGVGKSFLIEGRVRQSPACTLISPQSPPYCSVLPRVSPLIILAGQLHTSPLTFLWRIAITQVRGTCNSNS